MYIKNRQYITYLIFKDFKEYEDKLDTRYIDNGKLINTECVLQEKEFGFYNFIYNNNIMTTLLSIKQCFSLENTSNINSNQNTLKIKKNNAYIKSGYNKYNDNIGNEFTISFYFKIPKTILLNEIFFNIPPNNLNPENNIIHGLSWNNNKIILFDSFNYNSSDFYKNKCISITFCGTKHYVFFDYDNYNGEDWIYFVMTLSDHKRLRVFLNGELYYNTKVDKSEVEFDNIILGNYNPNLNLENLEVEFDEFCIANSCLYTENFTKINSLNISKPEDNNTSIMDNTVNKGIIKYNTDEALSPKYYNPYAYDTM